MTPVFKTGTIKQIGMHDGKGVLTLQNGDQVFDIEPSILETLSAGDFIACSMTQTEDAHIFIAIGDAIFRSAPPDQDADDLGWAETPEDAEIKNTIRAVEGNSSAAIKMATHNQNMNFRPAIANIAGIGDVFLYPTEQEAAILSANSDILGDSP